MAKKSKRTKNGRAGGGKSSPVAGRKRIVFTFKSKPGLEVAVAGSFNDWDVNSKVLKDKTGKGEYEVITLLAKGEYEYKFCVDGKWCVDPDNPNFKTNPHGTLNSIIVVD